jgi:hypothetical protein
MYHLPSRKAAYRVTCRCGHTFETQVYEYVNVVRDPHLRYAVLAGLLNVVTCPACGKRAQARRPFIYSDPPNQLLVYVHPRDNAPEQARELIEASVQSVYEQVRRQQHDRREQEAGGVPETMSDLVAASSTGAGAEEMPPLQVIFGLDQLALLINAGLSHEERLRKIALRTASPNAAERGQMLDIARRLAREMQCIVEEEEQADSYVVWLYGPRKQITALMRALAPRG